MREAFLNASQPLFYRTDHHMNADGVYLAYTFVCGAMGIEPLTANAFSVLISERFYGSNYARSGLWLTKPDEMEMWSPPCEVRITFGNAWFTDEGLENAFDSMFFGKHLSGWDQYSVFLDGNHPLARIENMSRDLSVSAGKTLLVIKDSYANCLIPLLIPHFDEIIAVDLRYFRTPVTELAQDSGFMDKDGVVLIVYSAEHIVNDTNILWLR